MRTLETRLTSPLGFAAVIAAAMLIWLVAFTGASAAGNRGTVKVHDSGGAAPEDRNNEPKVCDFTLHFFGGNPDESGTWWIQAWPDDGAPPADFGTYTSDADGNAMATQSDRLADGHYKLFWGTFGDHAKHKVFKVDCPETPPAPPGGG